MLVGKHSGLGTTFGLPDNLSEAKAQWCTTFPFFCSSATVAASTGLLNPDLYYPQPPVPTHDIEASQSTTQRFFDNLSTPPTSGSCTQNLGIGICDWMVYLGGALLVLPLAFSAMESGPRRYGR